MQVPIARLMHILVPYWVDIPAASLEEQRNAIATEVFFDQARSRTREIGGIASAGCTLDRMASELVQHGQG